MEKQESKRRFPAFPQPRRLRTITTYGIRILRARSVFQFPDNRVDEERDGKLVADHQTGAKDRHYVQKVCHYRLPYLLHILLSRILDKLIQTEALTNLSAFRMARWSKEVWDARIKKRDFALSDRRHAVGHRWPVEGNCSLAVIG